MSSKFRTFFWERGGYVRSQSQGLTLNPVHSCNRFGEGGRQHRASYGERSQQSPALALSGRSTLRGDVTTTFNRLHVPPSTKESPIQGCIFSKPGFLQVDPGARLDFLTRDFITSTLFPEICEMPWLNACLCSPEDRPRPSVSAPLHLLLKSEQESQCHAFRTKTFKKPRPCNYCHQPIYNEGSSCRVCKYLCHKACEEKNAAELASRNVTPYKQGWPTETQPRPRRDAGSGMDLTYITERILALWFPSDTGPQEYRHGHQEAAHMLHSKHGNNYMVFNLSEPRGGTRREHVRVREVGWPPDLAPPLERLCSVCKDIDSWLSEDSSRIAVLHARGNRERIGVIVAAYMHYSSICGSPEQALDRFAMKRYLDHKVGDLELPSNRRYVDYFSGLLSGCIRINSAPLYLTHVTVLGAPSFEPGTCGCRAFLKVYEGLVPVYTSGIHTVSQDTRQFTVTVAGGADRRGLQLRGDILVKCYHRHYCNDENSTRCSSPGDSSVASGEPLLQRELIFACQFHTCAVTDHTLSFTRQELDIACNDLRFPLDGAVELHFAGRSDTLRVAPAPTPAVPVDSAPDAVTRWDSYEHLDHPPPLSPDSDTTEDPNDGYPSLLLCSVFRLAFAVF
ncbi:hypothetical protein GE061_010190 [Apolygus lucorum]|uniref:Tensin n=1 Tax=Apolygus lucorum TaxID=248454 RepID=A0A8S9Y2I8_APOLU|nr:hypothetical protein GE061_010190 [Apolygus lucorum]